MKGSKPQRIPSTNFALCGAVLIEFSGIVQDQVHEGVKATEDTLDLTAAIDPQTDLLIHELFQLWRMSIGHDGCFLMNLL